MTILRPSFAPLRPVVTLVAAGVALSLLAPAGAVAAPKPVLTPIAAQVLYAPNPVRGADNRVHLAYEIKIANQSPSSVDINSAQPLRRGRPTGRRIAGAALTRLLRLDGGLPGTTIGPGQGAMLFMDVTYRSYERVPRSLSHRFVLTLHDGQGNTQHLTFVGTPTAVRRHSRPVVVRPPLRGSRWVVGNGCCDPIKDHRAATLAIDGRIRVAERFAIDFVQLTAGDRLFEGPIDALSSYLYFGDRVHSATKGVVVRTQDGQPEQVPGALPTGQTVQTAGGNYIVVRLDRRHYVFYAHLQPGRLKVKVGDKVRPGQVLGFLGNTGNTDAPHLHFHVMDGPDPLRSNGLPYVFTRFRGTGRVTDEAPLFAGDPTPIDRQALAGLRHDRLPLDDQVIRFP